MNKIKFLPSNVEVDCAANETIFEAAERVNVEIQNSCGGSGSCGECRVKIINGEGCLNKPTKVEIVHLGNVFHITHKRLACQCVFIKNGSTEVKIDE